MTSAHEPEHLFVTGTDTDVGKSVVSYLLLKAIQAAGHNPLYLKPLQTGCVSPEDPSADAAFIASQIKTIDPIESTLCCLPQAKAPWLAAVDAGRHIDTDQLIERLTALRRGARQLVIEGAGGIMVPITRNFLMLDLMARLDIPVILVARDSLGTINHTLLSVAVLKGRGIPIRGVVLTAQSPEATPPEMVAQNRMAIEHFARVPVAGTVEWLENFKRVSPQTENTIHNLLAPKQMRRKRQSI